MRNREWIADYEDLGRQRYLIGSGAAEKACDVIVAKRMKKKGIS
jgi:hypothetical protein